MNIVEFREWQSLVKAGETAKATRLRNKLIQDNLKFVRQQVMRLLGRTGVPGEPEDLIQGASFGLVKALERWDPDKGAFTTYAAWWIRNEFQATLAMQPQISRPKGSGMAPKVRRQAEAIQARTGRPATPEELGVKQRVLDEAAELPLMISLQGPGGRGQGDGDDSSALEYLGSVAADQESAEEVMISEDFADALRRALNWLEPEAREIVESIYLREEKVQVLAARLGRSPEYIRLAKEAALRELREELEP